MRFLYPAWRIVYTVYLSYGVVFYLFDPRNELGKDLGYLLIAFGFLPSIILLFLNYYNRSTMLKYSFIYGAIVFIGGLIVASISYGDLALLALSPLIGFPIESIVIKLRGL